MIFEKMEVEGFETVNYLVTEIQNIDPIRIYIEDIAVGVGRIVLTCYGRSYTAFWSGMGKKDTITFFLGCSVDYLASKLAPNVQSMEIDYQRLSVELGWEVDEKTLMVYSDKMADLYGPEWMVSDELPKKESDDWWYVSRIIKAAQAALGKVKHEKD